MMQEASTDDVDQWANFSTFDFTDVPVSPSSRPADVLWSMENEEVQFGNDSEDASFAVSQSETLQMLLDQQNELRESRDDDYMNRMKEMEQEQDMLNSSLMSLTTHFAQVQFRLKQISTATDVEAKEKLIKELELFAFEGCPDVRGVIPKQQELETEAEHQKNYEKQVLETKELIQRLQKQLTEVEQWAYETGQAEAPSMAVLEKQKMILDTLGEKVKFGIDGYQQLSPEELRQKVDEAIESIISPYRKKEIAQERTLTNLQTFVEDLERYIVHLQRPVAGGKPSPVVTPTSSPAAPKNDEKGKLLAMEGKKQMVDQRCSASSSGGFLINAFRRAYTVIQYVTFVNWACVSERKFHKNVMKTTTKGNHWGDTRAVFELSVSRVKEIATQQQQIRMKSRRNERLHNGDEYKISDNLLTKVVRKELAVNLCGLMQHGLIHLSSDTSLVPRLVCASRRSEPDELHPWDFVLKYYEYKKGNEFNRSATKKLSDSFQLTSVGQNSITPLQTLLSTVGDIVMMHDKFKRSPMTHFKAFVCAGLNQRSLSTWLRLIYCTKPVIEEYYMPWSYAAKTHFEDACRSLDSLHSLPFSLSTDLAVKPFRSLDDAF